MNEARGGMGTGSQRRLADASCMVAQVLQPPYARATVLPLSCPSTAVVPPKYPSDSLVP